MKTNLNNQTTTTAKQTLAPITFNVGILDVKLDYLHFTLSNQPFDGAVRRHMDSFKPIKSLVPDTFWSTINNQRVYMNVSANPNTLIPDVSEGHVEIDYVSEESVTFPFDVITQPQVITTLKIQANEDLERFYKQLLRDELIQHCHDLGWKTSPNFVRDVEIWVEQPTLIENKYKLYKKFTARFHHNEFNVPWALSISYQKNVYTVPLNLANAEDLRMNQHIMVGNTVWLRKKYQGDEAELKNEEIVLHYDAIPEKLKQRKNPFENHPLLFQKENKVVFNLLAKHLKQSKSSYTIIKPLEDEALGRQATLDRFELSYKDGKTGFQPKTDLKQFGPAEQVSKLIRIVPIASLSSRNEAQTLVKHFFTENRYFNHLQNYFKSNVQVDHDILFYENILEPEHEIMQALTRGRYKAGERIIAFIIHPFQKHDELELHRNIYHRLKEQLLQIGIVSQFIYKNHAYASGLDYFNVNVASALLAKAGFQPWRLKTPYTNSLVIGIGMFNSVRDQKKYSGVTVCLKGDGFIHQHDVFQDKEQQELMGMLHYSIRNAIKNNPETKSLIIHVLRQVSRKELKPLYAMLKTIKVKIPVFIVSINEGGNRQVYAMNNREEHRLLRSGTVIQQNNTTYLAYVNDFIQPNDTPKRFLFPVSMQVVELDKQTSTYKPVEPRYAFKLIEHAIQLARLNFQTVQTQPLPISVLAAKRVAEQMAYMETPVYPKLDKKQQWYW